MNLRSSLSTSITNHTPSDTQVTKIEEIRQAADDLCSVIDTLPASRETSLAKTHLEEVVMWAVKSTVLPR